MKKILVVEDEKSLLMAIKSKLELEGYEVFSAEDGEKGVFLAEKEHPDLILLDILLPKKDGFEVLEALKEKKIDVPIIIISNSGQPVELERALELGAKDYLIKADFTPDEVLGKIKKNLRVEFKKKKSAILISNSPIKTGSTILIVEDDEFLREVMNQKLKSEGFKTLTAIDAGEAFEVLKKEKPQVILLDLILPGMDGFEVLDQLKKDDSSNDIPVIVLSNLGQKEDMDRATAAGAADYLIKADYTPAEIVQHIRKIIGQKYI